MYMSRINTEGIRQRPLPASHKPEATEDAEVNLTSPKDYLSEKDHPAGPVKHGPPMQYFRIAVFAVFFFIAALGIHSAQLLGAPLYFYNKDYFYAWQAVCKQYFALVLITGTYLFAPTVIRISGDASVAGQLRQFPDGRLECDFPERMVLIANHQIYTDWTYLWWVSYTAACHGHIYIILKESLKYIPMIGPGMMFYNFIFMSRKWAKDQPRLKHRLQKLSTRHTGPMTGRKDKSGLDPAWLLLFPEGTNLSPNTRNSSKRWSEKSGIPDMKHQLLPRSTGLHFCLEELKDGVDWLYDCTIAYEGVPRGSYGGQLYTLRSVYFQGRAPKSVNMHWRRFRIADIPLHSKEETEEWLLQRWREKDDLIEYYLEHGRFPADPAAVDPVDKPEEERKHAKYIETEVRPKSAWEPLQLFAPLLSAYLLCNILIKLINLVLTGRLSSD
ncbi:acyltransferase-domain-containing protein [Aureobasidium pullulans]|uniref:Acyltransferase-domain-containing protein n=1 Tax=Aureobasidium pullulans TaxID=5580 RepID=A0A4S9U679_AURPU|nr:acyltransferase-domain-containing protein [Aureobasidium pullulans]